MASVIVRTNREEQLPLIASEAAPIRFMRWDPFREMAPSWPGQEQPRRFTPDFEVKETQDGFVFTADIPGVKQKDLEITMTGNRLIIAGNRGAQEGHGSDAYFVCERAFGGFTRAFTLPEGADGEHIDAQLDDGVLCIVLPKKRETEPRRIILKNADRPPS